MDVCFGPATFKRLASSCMCCFKRRGRMSICFSLDHGWLERPNFSRGSVMWIPSILKHVTYHGNLRYPPPKATPPRNKALIAGLIKGNQWLIVPIVNLSQLEVYIQHMCHGQKLRFIGDGRPPTFNRKSL